MLEYPFVCKNCNVELWYDFEDELWRHYEHEGETCGHYSPDTHAEPRRKIQPTDGPRISSIQLLTSNLLLEVERLQNIIKEILPFLINDVEQALILGPPPEGHNDDCEDCKWYAQSLDFKRRLDAGEFEISYKNISELIKND